MLRGISYDQTAADTEWLVVPRTDSHHHRASILISMPNKKKSIYIYTADSASDWIQFWFASAQNSTIIANISVHLATMYHI